MKYKLLKPIKGMVCSIGEEIEIFIEGETEYNDKVRFDENVSAILTQLLLDNGYIEEYDPDKKREPSDGENYYYFSSDFSIHAENYNPDFSPDVDRLDSGNYFKTEQEARSAVQKIKQFISNGMK